MTSNAFCLKVIWSASSVVKLVFFWLEFTYITYLYSLTFSLCSYILYVNYNQHIARFRFSFFFKYNLTIQLLARELNTFTFRVITDIFGFVLFGFLSSCFLFPNTLDFYLAFFWIDLTIFVFSFSFSFSSLYSFGTWEKGKSRMTPMFLA